MYYSPLNTNISDYYVAYSEKLNSYQYGTTTGQGRSNGVLSYTVNSLTPNITYYFKVRGQNGCMPGDWGNEMKVKTGIKGQVVKISYYRDGLTKILTPVSQTIKKSNTPIKTVVQGTKTSNEFVPTYTPIPTPTPIPQASKPAEVKKKCFLFWCW